MNRRLFRLPLLFFLLSLTFPFSSALAVVPSTITYQGSLKEYGEPVNRTVSMEFRLTNEDGSQLYWTSGPTSVDVREGLYRVELAPTGVDWTNVSPFMETLVEGNLLLPREKLTSAPYALLARELASGATIQGDISMNGHKITDIAALQGWIGTNYRRPNLVWAGVDRVDVENNTGTAHETRILFPDGEVRSVIEDLGASQNYRSFLITQTACFTGGAIQGGLEPGFTEQSNAFYALYAVKVTKHGETDKFVLAGTTKLPIQSDVAALNASFGLNAWVYLGLIRNGNNAAESGNILDFVQAGPVTLFKNTMDDPSVLKTAGVRMTYANWTNICTYTTASGMGASEIPPTVSLVRWYAMCSPGSTGAIDVSNAESTRAYDRYSSAVGSSISQFWSPAVEGVRITGPWLSNFNVGVGGFVDSALSGSGFGSGL